MKEFGIFLLYVVSVLGVVGGSPGFFVVTSMDFVLGVGILIGPVFLLRMLLGSDGRASISAVHGVAALLVHPAFSIRDPKYTESAEQFELLKLIHSGQGSVSSAASLAKALAEEAALILEVTRPIMYWAYPPSVVLMAWAVAFLFFLPSGKLGDYKERGSG